LLKEPSRRTYYNSKKQRECKLGDWWGGFKGCGAGVLPGLKEVGAHARESQVGESCGGSEREN